MTMVSRTSEGSWLKGCGLELGTEGWGWELGAGRVEAELWALGTGAGPWEMVAEWWGALGIGGWGWGALGIGCWGALGDEMGLGSPGY